MKILQITAVPETAEGYFNVLGLGDDQKVYYWECGHWLEFDPDVRISSDTTPVITTATTDPEDTQAGGENVRKAKGDLDNDPIR